MLRIRTNRARLLFQQIEQEWTNCQRCPLQEHRFQVVQARGAFPCRLLFVGEAPGQSEDAVGEPFVGKAGAIFDALVAAEIDPLGLTWAVINTVGCRPTQSHPLDPDERVNRTPRPEEMEACSPRFRLLLQAAHPTAVVHMGVTAFSAHSPRLRRKESLPSWVVENRAVYGSLPVLHIPHPAYMLRHGGLGSEPYQRARLLLRAFLQDLSL